MPDKFRLRWPLFDGEPCPTFVMMEQVILVDQEDRPLGLMEKMEAHREGRLHRAFSVFVFDNEGKMLIHRRALGKYHSGGLWTNTCCSHPRDHETTMDAAHRRLQEEMGFDCELEHRFHFIYEAELDHGLSEHELDHVFTGIYEAEILPNAKEVMDYKYISVKDLLRDIEDRPEDYTVWFRIALPRVLEGLGVKHS